jgi:hypothetical protein
MRERDDKTRADQNPRMEPQPNEERDESTTAGGAEPTQQTPRSKLRDLRPEIDPIGAGRERWRRTGGRNSPGKTG